MIPDTASVEVHEPPEADVPLSVTTCSLPSGAANVYPWSYSNAAISTEPDGHDWLPPFWCDDVVEIKPASESTVPSSMALTPILAERLLPSDCVAFFTMSFSGSRADGEKTSVVCASATGLVAV
jgi:hypothetical protein